MVDSDNTELLKFFCYHYKTKKMCKKAVKKLPFVKMYVLDRYKTQEICDKVILENSGVLKFFPDC